MRIRASLAGAAGRRPRPAVLGLAAASSSNREGARGVLYGTMSRRPRLPELSTRWHENRMIFLQENFSRSL